MRIVVRKGPVRHDAPEGTPPMVVLEVWMEAAEAYGLDLNGIALGNAVGAALGKHLKGTTKRTVNLPVEK